MIIYSIPMSYNTRTLIISRLGLNF